MKQELTCICCPMGCTITAEVENDAILSVSGYGCKRGEKYARQECVSPVRVVTASVAVRGGTLARASVKTSAPVDKALVMRAMDEIHGLSVCAPVRIGDVLLRDIAGSGADLLATRNVAAAS